MSRSRPAIQVLGAVVLLLALLLAGCAAGDTSDTEDEAVDTSRPPVTAEGEDVATIYLAGGCFWGVEKLMTSVHGVIDVESGYANGDTESPTYSDVTTGRSGYTETVRVDYDPAVAPLPFLLEIFYMGIEPTSLNRQGNDVGTQYRTGIYYEDAADAQIIETSLAELQEQYDEPVVVEAEPLTGFTLAEDYHQDYLEKNPGGYCHIDFELFEEAAAASPSPDQFPEESDAAE